MASRARRFTANELFARSITAPSTGTRSSMARKSVRSFRLVAVWMSSRLPSSRSRSTALEDSTSTICDDARRSPATSGTLGPGSENTTRSTALASTYFTGILAHRAQRRLDVDGVIEGRDLELPPVLGAQPEPTIPRQSLAPWRRLGLRRA